MKKVKSYYKSTGFPDEETLPSGAGKIQGKVLLDNEPCIGCGVYLWMGEKHSEFVKTDKNGSYIIRVPTGTYSDITTYIEPPYGVKDVVKIKESESRPLEDVVISAEKIYENAVAKIGRTIKLKYPNESRFVTGSDISFEWGAHPKVQSYKLIVFPYISEIVIGRRLGTAISSSYIQYGAHFRQEGKVSAETKESKFLWKGLGKKLSPNKIYVWGVEAYDKKGELITSSDVSDLRSCLFYYAAP